MLFFGKKISKCIVNRNFIVIFAVKVTKTRNI